MILYALLQRLLALVSLFILGLGGWLGWSWWDLQRDAEALGLPEPSDDRLWWALGLLAFSFFGQLPLMALLGRPGSGLNTERGESQTVAGGEDQALHVEVAGEKDGPILLLTHGWGMSSRVWAQTRDSLSERFGVAAWDLPGAGRSKRRHHYSLDGLADDLAAVINSLPPERPVVLVGHSIGGMTVQTLCARRPELMNTRVAGIVLENTTHRDPLNTMILSGPLTALQPVIELMLKLDVLVSPLLWVMNWQSYLSGSTHVAMRIAGFGSQPTYSELNLAALLPTKMSPAVQAKGNLAMLRWVVTEELPRIDVPALVFVGDRDLVTKDHAGEEISAALPHGRLVRIKGAGHMGPLEKSAAYDEEIAAFVATLSGAGGATTARV